MVRGEWTTPPSPQAQVTTPPPPSGPRSQHLPPPPLGPGHNTSPSPPGQQHLPPPSTVNGRTVRILLECILVTFPCYPPQTKLREGNVFINVCHSVHGVSFPTMPSGRQTTPPPPPKCRPHVRRQITPLRSQTPLSEGRPPPHRGPAPFSEVRYPPRYSQQLGDMHPTRMHNC